MTDALISMTPALNLNSVVLGLDGDFEGLWSVPTAWTDALASRWQKVLASEAEVN